MSKLDELADLALEAQIAVEIAKEAFEQAKQDFIAEAKKQGRFDPSLKAAGNAKVNISPNRYFDASEAEKFVSKKVLKECQVTKVDPKLLKNHLTPIQVEQAMKNHSEPYKLGFKVLTD